MQEIKKGWKKVKLLDIAEVIMGQSPKSGFYTTNKNDIPFFQGCTEFQELYPIVSKYCSKPTKLAKNGDILMSVRAPVGALNLCNINCCIGRGLCSINSKNHNNNWFLFYLLKGNLTHIQTHGGGAVYDAINKNTLLNIELLVPEDITIQQKIASVLSKYDDLIENNNKRIKNLEETAQAIYEEWFVNYNFSGSENVKMVDSGNDDFGMIPEGWEIKSILDIEYINFIRKNIKEFEGEKIYYATADIDGINITGKGEIVNSSNKPSRAQKQPVLNSVWFARMIETFKVLGFSNSNKNIADNILLSSGMVGFVADALVLPFLFFTINSKNFHLKKDQYCTGATQRALTNSGLKLINIISPSIEVVKEYGEINKELLDEILLLQIENNNLKQTRDLLIPRLVSGELNVEDLDVKL